MATAIVVRSADTPFVRFGHRASQGVELLDFPAWRAFIGARLDVLEKRRHHQRPPLDVHVDVRKDDRQVPLPVSETRAPLQERRPALCDRPG